MFLKCYLIRFSLPVVSNSGISKPEGQSGVTIFKQLLPAYFKTKSLICVLNF